MDTDRSSRDASGVVLSARRLLEEQLTRRILRAFYDMYNELGPGFLESVYCNASRSLWPRRGCHPPGEVLLPVHFRGTVVGEFRADVVVMARVVIEVKAGRALDVAHDAQLDNYLHGSGIDVGLLLHFGSTPTFRRRIRLSYRDPIRVHP